VGESSVGEIPETTAAAAAAAARTDDWQVRVASLLLRHRYRK